MVPCSVNNLKKHFGRVKAVDDASFTLREGEIIGFIGPNGAGKTTTIRAIMGLVNPDSGNCSVNGFDSFKEGHKGRAEVGYSGETTFFNDLSVKDNLTFVADVKGVSYDRINYLTGKLELDLTRKAGQLSAGNKKKLSIVVALLSSPQLIVLDEPTVGLDPIVRYAFFELIEEEKKRGATILISSHILSDIQRLCDRVAIIKSGKIIAIEEMEQLKTKRLKTITIETNYSNPQITLSGVSNLKTTENFIKFNYNGEMKKLVKYLNGIDLVNISIEDAGLEEMFLHFYE